MPANNNAMTRYKILDDLLSSWYQNYSIDDFYRRETLQPRTLSSTVWCTQVDTVSLSVPSLRHTKRNTTVGKPADLFFATKIVSVLIFLINRA